MTIDKSILSSRTGTSVHYTPDTPTHHERSRLVLGDVHQLRPAPVDAIALSASRDRFRRRAAWGKLSGSIVKYDGKQDGVV
jgi:hypothetical protein